MTKLNTYCVYEQTKTTKLNLTTVLRVRKLPLPVCVCACVYVRVCTCVLPARTEWYAHNCVCIYTYI